MALAVGGEFEIIGRAEHAILQAHGLRPTDYLIDIGCGSGRLAAQLAKTTAVARYLGTDVVPELLDYARATVSLPNWTFERTNGALIPEHTATADWVVLFSVFTHLPHEVAFLYLKESRRVLRPRGQVAFSFLEFANPAHWAVFAATVATVHEARHHNQFLERGVIRLWADILDMTVVSIRPGHHYAPVGAFAQTVCILRNSPPSHVARHLRTLWWYRHALPLARTRLTDRYRPAASRGGDAKRPAAGMLHMP